MNMTRTASVEDAIEMLQKGGVNLAAELSNIDAAYADIHEELMDEGFADVGFSAEELAVAIRAERHFYEAGPKPGR